MTENRLSRVAVVLLTSSALVGCVSYSITAEPSRVEANFGLAQRENTARMVANPRAEATVKDVTGLDPVTAQQVLTKYRNAQSAVAQPTGPSIINIGTGPR